MTLPIVLLAALAISGSDRGDFLLPPPSPTHEPRPAHKARTVTVEALARSDLTTPLLVGLFVGVAGAVTFVGGAWWVGPAGDPWNVYLAGLAASVAATALAVFSAVLTHEGWPDAGYAAAAGVLLYLGHVSITGFLAGTGIVLGRLAGSGLALSQGHGASSDEAYRYASVGERFGKWGSFGLMAAVPQAICAAGVTWVFVNHMDGIAASE